METYRKDDIDLGNIPKILGTIVVATVLVMIYAFVLANIFFSGILTKSFILSLVALPFLVYATIKLNKRFK